MLQLGLYMEANGNIDDAIRYYKKSADKGHVESQYRLAYLYDEKDLYEDAIDYYKEAIDSNHSMAKLRLGNLYNRKKIINRLYHII